MDDYDQDGIISDAVSNEKQNVVVQSGPVDHEETANTISSKSVTNKNTVDAGTLEKRFTDRTDRKMGNLDGTVEGRIENTISTPIDIIINLRVELVITSMNESRSMDVTSPVLRQTQTVGII